MGLLDKAHHAGVGGLLSCGRRDQVDGRTRIDHTAADGFADKSLHRQWFTGECRLVQGSGGEEPPVHRDDLPCAHEEAVTEDDLVDRDLDDPTFDPEPGSAGCTLDQKAQLATCARGRARFQDLPAGEHHGDHGAGERLVDREGAGQCQHRDHVDARLAAPDRGDCPEQRERKSQKGARDPKDVGGCLGGKEPRRPARRKEQGG